MKKIQYEEHLIPQNNRFTFSLNGYVKAYPFLYQKKETTKQEVKENESGQSTTRKKHVKVIKVKNKENFAQIFQEEKEKLKLPDDCTTEIAEMEQKLKFEKGQNEQM